MILGANVKEALTSLTTSKQRTLLALIGIVIGIGSVIGMISIGSIVQNEALKQFKEMGIDIISVRKEHGGKREGGLLFKDIVELVQHVKTVKEVAPYLTSSVSYGQGKKTEMIEMMGATETFFRLNKLRIREGRPITDLDENRYFCVIGHDSVQSLRKFGISQPLGSQIALGKRIYTIVGVLEKVPEGGGMRPFGINNAAIIHLSTARRAFKSPEISVFLARVGGEYKTADLKRSIQDYFSNHAKGFRVNVQTAEELIERMQKQMRMFTLLLGAIGSIALIVGGIGVMNVMLISVTERRKEIGIRRALGAQQTDIQSQFIIESVALCIVGGFIGIILGTIVSFVFAYFTKWEFIVSYAAIILGFGVATAVGVFFGFYPARTAAKLDPIKALRS
jgi:putative ABC transport system permease protein